MTLPWVTITDETGALSVRRLQDNFTALSDLVSQPFGIALADGTTVIPVMGTVGPFTLSAGADTSQGVTLTPGMSAYRVFCDVEDAGGSEGVTHSVVYNSSTAFTIFMDNLGAGTATFSMVYLVLGSL